MKLLGNIKNVDVDSISMYV